MDSFLGLLFILIALMSFAAGAPWWFALFIFLIGMFAMVTS